MKDWQNPDHDLYGMDRRNYPNLQDGDWVMAKYCLTEEELDSDEPGLHIVEVEIDEDTHHIAFNPLNENEDGSYSYETGPTDPLDMEPGLILTGPLFHNKEKMRLT